MLIRWVQTFCYYCHVRGLFSYRLGEDELIGGTVEPTQQDDCFEISPESNGSGKSIDARIPSKDGEYIKKHLGAPLCLALAEIVRLRPSDPIHFLGHWLMKWRWNNDEKERDEDRVHALIAEQKRIEEQSAENKRKAEERLQKEKDALRAEAEEVVILEIDWLFAIIDFPDLPEREEPEPMTEPEVKDDESYRERDSVRSYDAASELNDEFYDDPPRSPKSPRSEDYLDYDDYDD